MKLLLTSGGVTNPSIRDALIDLLGKPIAESSALCIPTAQWGHPMCGPTSVRGFVIGESPGDISGLGWKSVGVLELTALPSIGAERWVAWVRQADVLLVDGGDATYLCHWMRQSGLADLLPSLPDMVWVGVSAGSMVMTPRIGAYFVEWQSAPDDRTLGVVDFSIFPHLNAFPTNTLADAERWAADIGVSSYAIDEQTALKVVDGVVEVVSEGYWKRFAYERAQAASADLNDVQRIVLSLPETTMDDDRIAFSVNNKGKRKGIAWAWMERVHPKQPRVPNLDVLAIRVRDLAEKDMLLAARPDTFFTEPHYNGFPAVLVRLAAIDLDELEGLIRNAWRCQAPAVLVRAFDAQRGS